VQQPDGAGLPEKAILVLPPILGGKQGRHWSAERSPSILQILIILLIILAALTLVDLLSAAGQGLVCMLCCPVNSFFSANVFAQAFTAALHVAGTIALRLLKLVEKESAFI
jgi:hypothetical protein